MIKSAILHLVQLIFFLLMSCSPSEFTQSGINKKKFQKQIKGKSVALYTLTNSQGNEVCITNFGARVVSLLVPNKAGVKEDVVLGFKRLKDYQKPKARYFGSVIGRYANRIGAAHYTYLGQFYQLSRNQGEHHSHGGDVGFNNKVWEVKSSSESSITLSYTSLDGEMGFPGQLEVDLTYTWTNNNELKIDYLATSDKPTPINLTHHSFFNLGGEASGKVDHCECIINADYYTAINEQSIPTGEIVAIKGTPLDFSKVGVLKENMDLNHPILKYSKGFDHNFILKKESQSKECFAASVYDPKSGRRLNVYTTKPGIQLYTANYLDGSLKGKGGVKYAARDAFCLEPQHFPDSPNNPHFPSTMLLPGNKYEHTTRYSFLVD